MRQTTTPPKKVRIAPEPRSPASQVAEAPQPANPPRPLLAGLEISPSSRASFASQPTTVSLAVIPSSEGGKAEATDRPSEGPGAGARGRGESSIPDARRIVAKAELSRGPDRAERLEAIRRRIQKALVYPEAARRFGWEGTTRVLFVLETDGHPTTIALKSSSRMAILDHEALAAVRRAAPYPYVRGAIVVPIVFDIMAVRSGFTRGGR